MKNISEKVRTSKYFGCPLNSSEYLLDHRLILLSRFEGICKTVLANDELTHHVLKYLRYNLTIVDF